MIGCIAMVVHWDIWRDGLKFTTVKPYKMAFYMMDDILRRAMEHSIICHNSVDLTRL